MHNAFNFTIAKQMELDHSTIMFFILIAIVFVGSFLLKTESFVDASGGQVQVSIKDLISLLNMTGSATSTTTEKPKESSYDKLRADLIEKQLESDKLYGSKETSGSDYYSAFKNDILQEVRTTVRDQLQKKQEGNVLTDSCIDSVANQQGTDWMRYIPGKNPNDYIRKDSIPCYNCNLA